MDIDIEILEDKENVLLGRREVKFAARFVGATPDRNKVREALRLKLGADPKLTVVERIDQPFGEQRVEGMVRIYKTEEGRKLEHDHILARENGTKGKKKEEKPAAPEKKAEEKK